MKIERIFSFIQDDDGDTKVETPSWRRNTTNSINSTKDNKDNNNNNKTTTTTSNNSNSNKNEDVSRMVSFFYDSVSS